MSDFYVGQEVVCVDAKPNPVLRTSPLELHRHYTIKAFVDGVDGTGILLVEVHQHPLTYGFRPTRFAPIKSDAIQIFRDMCINVKRNIDA